MSPHRPAPVADLARGTDWATTASLDEPFGLSETLKRTDAVLAEVCMELEQQWRERCPEPADLLRADLPEHLRSWLLPAAGKRLRPVMCHWGWVSAGGAVRADGRDDVVTVCAALELVHLFALVHDDVMDRSDSRRGRTTTHVDAAEQHDAAGAFGDPALFGDSIAILFGDLALTESWVLVGTLPAPLQRAWGDMLRELVQGQLLDVTGAAARRRDLGQARRVARLKSGAYTVQRPLLLGALAARADAPTLSALATYGGHLGEAFALRDDVLGLWGDPVRTGKPVGDDLLRGKATVLLAEARRLLPAEVAERHLGQRSVIAEADVDLLLDLMLDAGVREQAEHRVTAEVDLALAALEHTDLDPTGADALRDLARSIAWRHA
ncbi:MAG: polyprenyl synthetase family protein [Humibacillus sp.]|nr:polyprenyl synthetase family protein [Humibacillus sp.]